jgi:Na+-driven multidrug efflux pump
MLLLFGIIHAVFMLVYAEPISKILISNPDSAKYIEHNIKILA